MCSFRDEWLYNELVQQTGEKAEMLLHDPLMQLSKPKDKVTVGGNKTQKRRGRRNRTRKKNRWYCE